MLFYHPAYDANHCIFRLLLIVESVRAEALNIDTLRIMDFIVLFPNILKNTSIPRGHGVNRGTFKNIKEPYEYFMSPSKIMFELGNIQKACIKSLVAKNIIDKAHYLDGNIKRTGVKLPQPIENIIVESALQKEEWFIFLMNEFHKIPLDGENGLKKRTGLLEYRYDYTKT